MRVALAHDYLNQNGGAERVLEHLHDLYPDAPIYTSMYDSKVMPAAYRSWDIRTSFMQRFPFVTTRHQAYLMAYPIAFESFDLSEYDVVISNSSAFCKGVVTGPNTLHISYCLTPMRWVWNYRAYVERERLGGMARALLPPLISYLRIWDAGASSRVDRYVAISRAVASRIKKYYRRDSEIIYPPVDTEWFPEPGPPGDYFMTVGRLAPYQRKDLIVDAFRELGLPVKIVGDGRDRARLEARATPNIEFLGRVDDHTLRDLYANCRGYLFPGEEDFGIAPVEAQAAGKPVIAYAAGGALDTVIDGETGVHFSDQTPEALVAAVRRFESLSFDPEKIRQHAARFGTDVFREQFPRFVDQAYQEWRAERDREHARTAPNR
jgi:glycosyltransferase involved in cell wall biosynthesis